MQSVEDDHSQPEVGKHAKWKEHPVEHSLPPLERAHATVNLADDVIHEPDFATPPPGSPMRRMSQDNSPLPQNSQAEPRAWTSASTAPGPGLFPTTAVKN